MIDVTDFDHDSNTLSSDQIDHISQKNVDLQKSL